MTTDNNIEIESNRAQLRAMISDLMVVINTRVQVLDAINVVNINSTEHIDYVHLELEVKQMLELIRRHNHG